MSLPFGSAFFIQRMGKHTGEPYFTLRGDLNQMGTKEARLLAIGLPVVRPKDFGGLPGFRKEDEDKYLEALKYIWDQRIDGWWNEPLVANNVCSQDDFNIALTFRTL